jgi:TPR repeat protein
MSALAFTAVAETTILRDDWYLSQPGNKATLQLSGHRTEKAAIAYIRKNRISGIVGYFSTQFDGKPWFAVTYGAYSSVGDARKGLGSLPEALRAHAPWPRKFSAIQPLIDSPAAEKVTAAPVPVPVPQKQVAKAVSADNDAPEDAQAVYDKGDYKRAYDLWLIGANEGNAEAQFNIAVMYSRGEGVAQNNAKAIEWYTHSADQGYAPAQYNLGAAYLDGQIVKGSEALAASWWLKAAKQGFVQAQFNIGSLYCRGIGVAQDTEQCKHWYGKAADNGDEHARKMLDGINSSETSAASEAKQKPKPKPEPAVKKSKPAAVVSKEPTVKPEQKPAEKSSLKGNEWLMSRNPGHMTIQLYGGRDQANVRQFVKTHSIEDKSHVMTQTRSGSPWYTVAYGEFKNLSEAKKVDAELSSQFGITDTWVRTFGSIQEAIRKSGSTAKAPPAKVSPANKKVAPVPDKPASNHISTEDRDQLRKAQSLFVRGKYMDALNIWTPLAEKGIAEAQYSLGFLYHSGWGPERDLKKAVRWYSLAGEQEENRAQFNLGVLLVEGEPDGITVDYSAGVTWIKRSAKNGNTRARELLAEAYEKGLYDLPKSSKESQYWKSR